MIKLTSWISSDTGNNQNVATKEIEAITFIDHGRGRAEGIGIGILVGAAIAGGETGGKEMFIFTGRKEDSAP